MGRSALTSINLRGNQTLYRKLLAAGVTPLISSEGLGTSSELIHNLGWSQGQGFFAGSGCTGCQKGWISLGVSMALGPWIKPPWSRAGSMCSHYDTGIRAFSLNLSLIHYPLHRASLGTGVNTLHVDCRRWSVLNSWVWLTALYSRFLLQRCQSHKICKLLLFSMLFHAFI